MGGFFVVLGARRLGCNASDLSCDIACAKNLDVGLITPGRSHHPIVSCFLTLS